MSTINERIHHGDLEGTIDNIISIDEYQPKSGTTEQVVVVALFADNENPADDLNNFLFKGTKTYLDVDTSPNPDENNKYLIFVEFKRDPEFFEQFDSMIKDVSNVAGDMDWYIKSYLSDETFPYNENEWKDYVITKPELYVTKSEFVSNSELKDNEEEANINEFFSNTDILTISKKGSIMEVAGDRYRISFDIIDFEKNDIILEKNGIANKPIDLFRTSRISSALRVMLGEGWAITPIDGKYAISNNWDNRSLLINLHD